MKESESTNGLAVLTMRGCGQEACPRGFSWDSTAYPEVMIEHSCLAIVCMGLNATLHRRRGPISRPHTLILPPASTHQAGVTGFPESAPSSNQVGGKRRFNVRTKKRPTPGRLHEHRATVSPTRASDSGLDNSTCSLKRTSDFNSRPWVPLDVPERSPSLCSAPVPGAVPDDPAT
jgi:hypothetical protein